MSTSSTGQTGSVKTRMCLEKMSTLHRLDHDRRQRNLPRGRFRREREEQRRTNAARSRARQPFGDIGESVADGGRPRCLHRCLDRYHLGETEGTNSSRRNDRALVRSTPQVDETNGVNVDAGRRDRPLVLDPTAKDGSAYKCFESPKVSP